MSDAEEEKDQVPWLKINSTGRRALIVDDDPSNRKLLGEVLRSRGYTTVQAEDGIEALFALECEPVDIVVCDILMPNMDGYSLCAEVRRRSEWNDLSFILFSAIDFTPDDEQLALELGADRCIWKQSSPSVILKVIEEVIGEGRGGGAVYLRRTKNYQPARDMKKYSAAMVRQLEERSVALEQTSDELRKVIGQLEKRLDEKMDELALKNVTLESCTQELARANAVVHRRPVTAARDRRGRKAPQ